MNFIKKLIAVAIVLTAVGVAIEKLNYNYHEAKHEAFFAASSLYNYQGPINQ